MLELQTPKKPFLQNNCSLTPLVDCCKKKKDCCKNHTDNNQNNDGCGGKCKNASCHCPTAPLAFALTLDAGMKNHFIVLEKLTIGYTQSYISSGFHSIWQPPKIS